MRGPNGFGFAARAGTPGPPPLPTGAVHGAAGVLLDGPNIPLNSTVIAQVKFDVDANNVALGWGTASSGACILFQSALQLFAFGSASGTAWNGPRILSDVWYWMVITMDGSGNLRFAVGRPRRLPSAPNGANTLQFSALGLGVGNAGDLQLLGFDSGFSNGAAVRGVGIWHSVLSDAEITAACQPGVVATSAWGAGGLPSTPDAYYNLSSTSDLSDGSGSGAPNLVVSGGSLTDVAAFTAPPSPLVVTSKIYCNGDSLTFGSNQNLGGYPIQLGALRPTDTVSNSGVPGQTTTDWIGQIYGSVMPAYDPAQFNLALTMIGTNNVGGGGTAVAAYADIIYGINLLQSMGFCVGNASILPYGLAYPQPEAAALRALAVANSAGADYVIDIGGDPYFVPTDPLIYDAADQLHLLQATGYVHEATTNHNTAINAFYALY